MDNDSVLTQFVFKSLTKDKMQTYRRNIGAKEYMRDILFPQISYFERMQCTDLENCPMAEDIFAAFVFCAPGVQKFANPLPNQLITKIS